MPSQEKISRLSLKGDDLLHKRAVRWDLTNIELLPQSVWSLFSHTKPMKLLSTKFPTYIAPVGLFLYLEGVGRTSTFPNHSQVSTDLWQGAQTSRFVHLSVHRPVHRPLEIGHLDWGTRKGPPPENGGVRGHSGGFWGCPGMADFRPARMSHGWNYTLHVGAALFWK